MSDVRVRVLGEFAVDGLDLAALGGRKARQFLLLLALSRGQPAGVDRLIDALWGDHPPRNPGDQLAVLASRVRRQLGADRIVRGDEGYRLRYDWLDVDELDAVVAEAQRRRAVGNRSGAAAAARIALSLVRGEPTTAGMESAWAGAQVAAVARAVAQARRVAARSLLEAGQPLDAVELLSAEVDREPYDEDAVRLLMRAEVAAGRPAAALAVFASCRARLAEELGAEPAPETSALHTAILRNELDTATRRLESGGRPMVGRDRELTLLDALLSNAGVGGRVVLILGEAGIGKSTLLTGWGARREAAGTTVVFGRCGLLERSVPLDAVIVALAEHLRRLGATEAERVLGPDVEVLGPLLGVSDRSVTRAEPLLADRDVGPIALFAALTGVLARLCEGHETVLLLDDVHLAGPALAGWLNFLARRRLPVLVVATARPGEGEVLPATTTIMLGPLDAAATAELVGPERAGELHARSAGHPLLLTELAAASSEDLPASLIAAVSARCDELGAAAETVRSAAVLGPLLDVDLLAAVLHRPAINVLDDVELGTRRGLLVEQAGRFVFRHELVRAALAAGTTAPRRALLHREVGRALAGRPGVDPIEVAEHARLGGELQLATRFLRAAATRAGERYDHATAAELLDRALELHPDPDTWRARARARTRLGDYPGALRDVERARAAGADAAEVGAWAAYFGRRFDDAVRYADDGAVAANDDSVRARCLMVGGRTRHARGDLADAETLLTRAVRVASGGDRVTASAWLGVLRSHQSRPDDAITLLSPAASAHTGVEHTAATLHALLFTGHAHAVAGRPEAALAAFERYSTEVERRHVPRFSGRGVNFSGWVLRNLGQTARGVEAHHLALSALDSGATPDLRVAALQDLAEACLHAADPDAASRHLAAADAAITAELVFGWRLAMRSRLLHARLQLLRGAAAEALDTATTLHAAASSVGVPRYATTARLLIHRARHRLGLAVDTDEVEADLTAVQTAIRLEAWWWIGDTASDLGMPGWLERAAISAQRLAEAAGQHRGSLLAAAERRLDRWAATSR